MRSYIRIYGPPYLKAIRALEKVAIDIPEVCIMNPILEANMQTSNFYPMNFFRQFGEVPPARCDNIISNSGVKVGEYDFYFEWTVNPDPEDLHTLMEEVDEALAPLGCMYTITNKPQ